MVLLVIDVQKGITDQRLYNYEGFLANTKKLIDAARANQVEVIYVQHDDGPGTGFSVGDEEFEIADQVTPLTGEKIYYKTVNSAFGNKELEA
ncbi:MAG: isochorismatase family protein, partial [Lachnospiraceae bacterium]|nr:isochorismatase family protein [Lachnospiraceae bacterium]